MSVNDGLEFLSSERFQSSRQSMPEYVAVPAVRWDGTFESNLTSMFSKPCTQHPSPHDEQMFGTDLGRTRGKRSAICIIVTEILMITISFTLALVVMQRIENLRLFVDGLRCVPCNESSPKVTEFKCCSKEVSNFYEILLKSHVINDTTARRLAKSLLMDFPWTINPRQCSAHLILQSGDRFGRGSLSKYRTVQGWSIKAENSHVNMDCIVPDQTFSTFTVSDSGKYVIYSQLSFIPSENHLQSIFSRNLSRQPIVIGQKITSDNHEFLRQSVAVSMPRIHNHTRNPPSQLGCGDDGGSLYISSVIGVVNLEKGDSLSVQALPVGWLCRWKSSSYFGFYRIA